MKTLPNISSSWTSEDQDTGELLDVDEDVDEDVRCNACGRSEYVSVPASWVQYQRRPMSLLDNRGVHGFHAGCRKAASRSMLSSTLTIAETVQWTFIESGDLSWGED